MIYGIGTDIITIKRIEEILEGKNANRFITKILTTHEQQIFKNRGERANYLAKRFAAKEAFAKALGTGIGSTVSFQDVTIRNTEDGKPYFSVSEKLRQYLISHHIKTAHLSISDEKNQAVAYVVLELAEGEKKLEAIKGF
ncbi:Holo-[acyl-carrier protein] synthase [hydrothermal vent metagenome]|uniref:Holo-[acyl-carrier protein] synthase n=1 Tax=hydrothermal vent metagenome TaxID=652676 RepID=A0A1W1CQG8_9ZZZZ